MENFTLINYADLYGISNGIYIAASLITFLFGASLVLQKNQRKLAALFFLASLAYLFFCAFNIYLQQYHFGDLAQQAYPELLLLIGKVSSPLALAIFTYFFVNETSMVSKQAFDFIDKFKPAVTFSYIANIAFFIGLFFIDDPKIAILTTFALLLTHLIMGVVYAVSGFGNLRIGKILASVFTITIFVYIAIIYEIASGGMSTLSREVVLGMHFFLAIASLVFCYIGISFGYDQIYKFDAVARGQNRQLTNHINNAIKNNEFFMVYQPKLDINDERVSGVEALIRWQHPKMGFIRPDQFIPVAESTHLIDSICRWVIVAACKQAKDFKDAGYFIPISINFSVKNLQPEMVHFFLNTLKEYQLDFDAIIIEVTETVFMQNNEKEQEALAILHKNSIPLSLDDYGTGFSSLSSINQLALSEIKIDRCFVSDLVENHEHHIIVRSTLHMSKELGVKVVAEGVEDLEMIQTLKEMHCDTVQGYGIAKPMVAEDMIAWLRSSGYSYIRKQTIPLHDKHELNI